MNRNKTIALFTCLLAGIKVTGQTGIEKPNIILLMGEDWEETGYNGHPFC